MSAEHRRILAVGVMMVGGMAVATPLAFAQTPEDTTPTTAVEGPSTIDASTTTPSTAPSTVPGAPSTVPEVMIDPTTGLPVVPTTVPDPFATNPEGLSSGAYAGQPAFDSVPKGVDPALVSGARTRFAAARSAYNNAVEARNEHVAAMAGIDQAVAQLGASKAADLEAAARAKTLMRERAVEAYIRGDRSLVVWAKLGDPIEYNRATRYLESLADQDAKLAEEYLASVERLSRSEIELAEQRSLAADKLSSVTTAVDNAIDELSNASFCLSAYEAGSRTCPDGFTFPVLGEVNFIDSFGFPRQVGNPNQHWHEGTDIMAPFGREIVAVEGGTITKVGDDSGLGGLRVWLEGDSGNRYYYAHFQSYVPGLAVGQRVEAGDVLGGAGNTGALGTPPHLHFEIYPAGSDRPINPFPILTTAWGGRAMLGEGEVSRGLSNLSGSVAPEED